MERGNFNNFNSIEALVSAYEQGEKEEGLTYFDESAFFQLIDFYEGQDRLEDAIEVADQAISQYLFSVDFYLRKAELLIDVGEESTALEILNKANSFAPEEPGILMLKVEALTYSGRGDEARHLLRMLKEGANDAILAEIYLLESIIFEYQELYNQMFDSIKKGALLDPENREMLERLWLAVELTRKYEESIELHEIILDEHPYSFIAWYNLAHAHAYLGNYEKAIDAYEFTMAIKQDFEPAYKDCADLCFETGNISKSLKYFGESHEKFNSDSFVTQRLGQCYIHYNDTEKASIFLLKSIEQDPYNDEAHYLLGLCYLAKENPSFAIKCFNKAIELEGGDEKYFLGLAEANHLLNEWEAAINAYERAIYTTPESKESWINYIKFLLEQENPDDALDVLYRSEEYLMSEEFGFAKSACLYLAGHHKEASNTLWMAMEKAPQEVSLFFELAPHLQQSPTVIDIISAF